MGQVRPIAVGMSVLLLGSALAATARGDRIVIRNGGAIKGKAILDEAHPDQYLVFGEKGKTPIVLKKERVIQIEPEPSVLDGYASRRKVLYGSGTPTAQGELELGLWAEEHKLRDLATLHYEAAIRRDPALAEAHKKLGHREYDGRWLDHAGLKQAQGFILHKGKWITAEEKEQRDLEAGASAEYQKWVARLAGYRKLILGGESVQSREALNQLLMIREEAAINPIVRVFGNDEVPDLRKLAARALGAIPGPKASAALVNRLLNEPEPEVREPTMEQISRSKEPNIVPKLVEGLNSKTLVVVNRAAWALGNLNAVSSVPRLIPALVRAEDQMVWVSGENSTNTAFGGAGSGNLGAGVGGVSGAGVSSGQSGVGGRHGSGMAGGLAGAGFTNNYSVPLLTGPVVGPGVVAFGATSVPSTALGGMAPGGTPGGVTSDPGSGRGPQPVIVQVPKANVEVRNALVKLTGKDFGYDMAAWRHWMSTSYHPPREGSEKKVPQP